MKNVTSAFLTNFLSSSPSPFILDLVLYRKWPGGEIYERGIDGNNRRYVVLYGCAGDFFHDERDWLQVGDVCLVTCYPGMDEYTIYSVDYDFPTNRTTVTFEDMTTTGYVSASPAYLYKKYTIPRKDILLDKLGYFSLNLDLPNMTEFDAGTFDIGLDNSEATYWNDIDKNGIMFNGFLLRTVHSQAVDIITWDIGVLGEQIADNVLIGNTVEILDGNAKGGAAIVRRNDPWSPPGIERIGVSETPSGLITGDKFQVNIVNEFIAKITVGTKEFPQAANRVNVFTGTVKSEDIHFNSIDNTVSFKISGFLKELDETAAYNACDFATLIAGDIPGIHPVQYDDNNVTNVKYGERRINFEVGDTELTGFNPTLCDPEYLAGKHRIMFKPPNKWRTDKGDWKIHTGEKIDDPSPGGTRVYLEDENGHKVYGDFKAYDYPYKPTIGYISVRPSAGGMEIENRGLFLSVEEGIKQELSVDPIEIVRDEAYIDGTFYGANIHLISGESPIKLVYSNLSANNAAFYIGFDKPVTKIYFENLVNTRPLFSTGETWDYSKNGTGVQTFGDLTLTVDTTDGVTQSGYIEFNAPEDWVAREDIGEDGHTPLYWIRCALVRPAAGVTLISVERLRVEVTVMSKSEDKFTFVCYPEQTPPEDKESILVLARDEDSSIITRKIGAPHKGMRIVDLIEELIKTSTLFQTYSLTKSDFEISVPLQVIYAGQLPPGGYNPSDNVPVLCFDTFLYIGMGNAIWRMNYTSPFKLLATLPEGFVIISMGMSTNDRITGVAIRQYQEYQTFDEVVDTILFTISNPAGGTQTLKQSNVRTGDVANTRLVSKGGVAGNFSNNDMHLGKVITLVAATTSQENPISMLREPIRTEREGLGGTSYIGIGAGPDYLPSVLENEFPYQLSPRNWVASTLFELTAWPAKYNQNFLYKLGQKGLYVNSLGQDERILMTLRINTGVGDRRICQFRIGTDNIISTGSHRMYGEGYDNTTYNMNHKFYPMHGIQGKVSQREILLGVLQDKEVVQVGGGSTDSDRGALIKITDDGAGNPWLYGILPYKLIKYDSSVPQYFDVTGTGNIRLDQNDALYIVGAFRFSHIHIDGAFSGSNTLVFERGVGDPASYIAYNAGNPNMEIDDYITPGSGAGFLMYPMIPRWEQATDPNLTVLGVQDARWIFRIRQTGTGFWLIYSTGNTPRITAHCYQLWDAGSAGWYHPMELCRRTIDDHLYTIILDRENAKYLIAAFDLDLIHTTNRMFGAGTIYNLKYAGSYPAEWDESMIPCNMVDGGSWKSYVYFTLTDPAYKDRTAKLMRMKYEPVPSHAITIEHVADLKEGCWGCSNLAVDTTSDRLYGICYNDEEYYLFEYGETLYIRMDSAEFRDKTTREALNELFIYQAISLRATEERKIEVEKKYPVSPTIAETWTVNNYILDILANKIFEEYYDQVKVIYKDGEAFYGKEGFSTRQFEFNADFIYTKGVAEIVAQQLYEYLSLRRRFMEISIPPLFYYEIKDYINIIVPTRLGQLDSVRKYMLVGLEYSLARGEGTATLLEVF